MLEAFARLTLALHQSCRRLEPQQFQPWVFTQLREIIPFDAALWGLATFQDGHPYRINSYHLQDLPDSLWADYFPAALGDPLADDILKFQGKSISLSDADFAARSSPEMLAYLGKYRIGHGLSALIVDPVTQLSAALSLYRHAEREPFNESERNFHQQIFPHLIESWSANRIKHWTQLCETGRRTVFNVAIVDRELLLHAVDSNVAVLLRLEWPNWCGPHVPSALKSWINAKIDEPVFSGHAIEIRVDEFGDTLLLRVRTKDEFDLLGEREQQVARLFATGRSHKEIARELKISPSTVSNQLTSIYKKLKISTKTQLTNIVAALT